MVKQDALCLLCLIVVNLSLGNYLLGLFASGLTKLFAFIIRIIAYIDDSICKQGQWAGFSIVQTSQR